MSEGPFCSCKVCESVSERDRQPLFCEAMTALNHAAIRGSAFVKEAREALEFYADKNNWENVLGHTTWNSNLKEQDCAFLNCGGGRARKVLFKYFPKEGE